MYYEASDPFNQFEVSFERAQEAYKRLHWLVTGNGPNGTMVAVCSCGWTLQTRPFRGTISAFARERYIRGQAIKHSKDNAGRKPQVVMSLRPKDSDPVMG